MSQKVQDAINQSRNLFQRRVDKMEQSVVLKSFRGWLLVHPALYTLHSTEGGGLGSTTIFYTVTNCRDLMMLPKYDSAAL